MRVYVRIYIYIDISFRALDQSCSYLYRLERIRKLYLVIPICTSVVGKRDHEFLYFFIIHFLNIYIKKSLQPVLAVEY